MKEVNERDTAVLLAALDRELDIKCMELKENKKQLMVKKLFFSSCLFILLSFIVQVFFKVFNVGFIAAMIFYQALLLVLLIPFIPNISKGVITK